MGIWLWTSVSWDGRAFLRRGSIDGYRSTRWRNHSAQNWATALVRVRLIDFLPFLLTTAGLFKDQKISVYIVCLFLFERHRRGSLGGEDKPQPLQFEARGIWKRVSHWRKIRTRKKKKKSAKRRNNRCLWIWEAKSDTSRWKFCSITITLKLQLPTLNSDLTLLAFLPHLAFMKIFDTLGSFGTFGRLWHTLTLLAQ